ncbi:MAG: hypothetical protein AW10_02368 [Candidatus Accumulibacter appositus]|uniref:Lipoprotein n=2 Tax=Candidatus Accumulibacter TaxID=327159 RepID=A0A011QKX3_9PROT|nr:MAG: hypothetical protein AW10_02368 [Candidatus Accumulibacter appositus]
MADGAMNSGRQACQHSPLLLAALLLTACAGYSGRGLQAGVATLPEVIATMGMPALSWQDPDGSEQLAYPRGPAGTQTFMVFIAPDGRLQRIEGVLDMVHFARVEAGKSDRESVLRLLGPSVPQWTDYFKARDELVWEWRFCDSWNQLARFDVLFDATTGIVRSTYQRPDLMGWDGVAPYCGH